ncbi:MAG: hypothetical protein KJ070_07860 [Verrucomicrobia bacterium]|nr:hypothetical protein [Verrucomicrobiota bacterium]
MKRFSRCLLAGALLTLPVLLGCSKKTAEVVPPPVPEEPAVVQEANPPAQNAAAAQFGSVQQVNANWDAVSNDIANQNYENAVRAWVAMDQARQQAAMNDALRAEYARRAYLAQEALRQRAETDAKARKAYQDLGRVMMGR